MRNHSTTDDVVALAAAAVPSEPAPAGPIPTSELLVTALSRIALLERRLQDAASELRLMDRVLESEARERTELIERQSATIRALGSPVLQVWDEILCLPVIGTVDSARTAEMMEGLLEAIVRERARFAIVDLTGVKLVDTSTADHLIRLFRAAGVLGVESVLCGIRPAVAQTIVGLGLELGSVRTMRSLRDALKWCIRSRAADRSAARLASYDAESR